MTSDELFWRFVLASCSVGEAALLWWLSASRADEFPHRSTGREISRGLGSIANQKALLRAAGVLVAADLVETRTLKNTHTTFRLKAESLSRFLGHIDSMPSDSAVIRFDPVEPPSVLGLQKSTACARLCMLRGNREDAILLSWLYDAGASAVPVRLSSRQLESLLGGLIDRRTAMRSLARLQSSGLVSVKPLGRAGTEYRLDGAALEALLGTFPFPEDAAATMPGWANLSFPLLQRLDLALAGSGAAATRAVDVAAMEA